MRYKPEMNMYQWRAHKLENAGHALNYPHYQVLHFTTRSEYVPAYDSLDTDSYQTIPLVDVYQFPNEGAMREFVAACTAAGESILAFHVSAPARVQIQVNVTVSEVPS